MAKRGRPPKSLSETNKHLTKEEIEKKKKAEEKIKDSLKITKVKAPDILRPEGDKLFKSLSKDLIKLGLFTQLDIYNLALYINLIIEYKELQSDLITIRREDFNTNDSLIIFYTSNPVNIMKMQKDCIKELKGLGSALGLNVGDRLKYIQMTNMDNEEEKEDKFDEKLEESNVITIKPIDNDLLDRLNKLNDIKI